MTLRQDYGHRASIAVPRSRIARLSREEADITADTALRLARYFGSTADFWLHLQGDHDKSVVEQGIAKEIKAIEPMRVT